MSQSGVAISHFDPLAPRDRDRAFRTILLISLAVHLLLLFLFWDAILGVVLEEEDTVVVRMMEEERQQPKPRPKLIQQTQINTDVQRQREFQHQIQDIQLQRLDQFQMKQIDPTRVIEAPKLVTQTELTVERVDTFADTAVPIAPLPIDTSAPRVRTIQAPSAPTAASPRQPTELTSKYNPEAVAKTGPTEVKGILSSQNVAGAEEGSKVAALQTGYSDKLLGDSGGSYGTKSEKDCRKDPVCLEYLKMIRDRVYARWSVPADVPPGKVVLSFRIDRGGSAHSIRQRHADDPNLGTTCVQAFRHASPFPPPPPEIEYLITKGISATFSYGN